MPSKLHKSELKNASDTMSSWYKLKIQKCWTISSLRWSTKISVWKTKQKTSIVWCCCKIMSVYENQAKVKKWCQYRKVNNYPTHTSKKMSAQCQRGYPLSLIVNFQFNLSTVSVNCLLSVGEIQNILNVILKIKFQKEKEKKC